MEFTFTFIRIFLQVLWLAAPLLLLFVASIVVLGQIVGYLERWRRFDAFYWSFITATTVGFGDIRPVRPVARVLSILVALHGIVLTGIIVAAAVQSAGIAIDQAGELQHLRQMLQSASPQERLAP